MFSIKSSLMLAGAALILITAVLCAAQTPQGSNPVVVIQTSAGDITVELFKDKAPKSVENFLSYVESGFYKGTIFHRVIKGFMIQGGGLAATMERKQTKPAIQNEAGNGLSNERGTIAMARTNNDVNSATSQFFINTVNNSRLNHTGEEPSQFGYAVFGKVIAGMDVVDKIEQTPTATKGAYADVPVQPITITGIRVKS
jgi:cyclophilin family peptidyl-prolyl cis-trans isomerase